MAESIGGVDLGPETSRSRRVLNWAEVRRWRNPYDRDLPPPVYKLPKWTVSKVLVVLTLSDPTVRGDPPPLQTIKEASKKEAKLFKRNDDGSEQRAYRGRGSRRTGSRQGKVRFGREQ